MNGFKLLGGLLVAVALVGCSHSEEHPREYKKVQGAFDRVHSIDNWGYVDMTIYRDKETGCEYLTTGSDTLIPRMNADGTQLCRK